MKEKDNSVYVEKMLRDYSARPQECDDLSRLRALDRRTRLPARILAICTGCAGALLLGAGMSILLGALTIPFAAGLALGIAGLAVVCANPLLYRAVLHARKKKNAEEILRLSRNLLGEE